MVTIELRELAHDITNNLLTGFPSAGAADRRSTRSPRPTRVIAVTPVFSASYSGLFKSFFDVLDPKALVGTPVLMAATGGSARHSLVLDYALRPLFSYLKATIVPTGVFAATADFGSDDAGRSLADRVHRAGRRTGCPAGRRHAAGGRSGHGDIGPGSGSSRVARPGTGSVRLVRPVRRIARPPLSGGCRKTGCSAWSVSLC